MSGVTTYTRAGIEGGEKSVDTKIRWKELFKNKKEKGRKGIKGESCFAKGGGRRATLNWLK